MLFLLLSQGVLQYSSGQSVEYPLIFGDDWKKAEQYVSENEKWMRPHLEKYKVDYYEAVSVIFPELVRYSALRDKMEITLLKALYINLGEEYANFSIGHFQMKPSFAETLIVEGKRLSGRKKPLLKDSTSFENIRAYRADIVGSLEDPLSQLNYLVIFFRVVSKKFNIESMKSEEKIKFLSTVYNSGIYQSEKKILEMSSQKFFSTKLVSTERYSYADVSLYWYHSVQKKNKTK